MRLTSSIAFLFLPALLLPLAACGGESAPSQDPDSSPLASKDVSILKYFPDTVSHVIGYEYGALRDHDVFRTGIAKKLAHFQRLYGIAPQNFVGYVQGRSTKGRDTFLVVQGKIDPGVLKAALSKVGHETSVMDGYLVYHSKTEAVILHENFLITASVSDWSRGKRAWEFFAKQTIRLIKGEGKSLADRVVFVELFQRIPSEARTYMVADGKAEITNAADRSQKMTVSAQIRYATYGPTWKYSYAAKFGSPEDAKRALGWIEWTDGPSRRPWQIRRDLRAEVDGEFVVARKQIGAPKVAASLKGRSLLPGVLEWAVRAQ